VILALGRVGATCKPWRVSVGNSLRNKKILPVKKFVYPLEITSVSEILSEYHVESTEAKKYELI
jgi:hypothetical protein